MTTSPPPQPDAGRGEIPQAQWSASLDVNCPKCGEYVDLMEGPEFWEGKDGLQIAEAVPVLDVYCPKCGHEFTVSTVW